MKLSPMKKAPAEHPSAPFEADPEEYAAILLQRMRATQMRRGPVAKRLRKLRTRIEQELLIAIPGLLARRIAFQLVLKIDVCDLGGPVIWQAIGAQLRKEMITLRTKTGMAERRIIQVLPKLSPEQIEALIEEISRSDRRIVRTILSAAAESADPLAAGRRFLAEYLLVVKQFEALDPKVARTLANATFMSTAPLGKAVDFYKHFADVGRRFPGDPAVSRMVAKVTLRHPSLPTCDELMERYNTAISTLVAQGMDPRSARSLATLRRFFDVSRAADDAPDTP